MGVNHRDSFIDISWRHAALTNQPEKETEIAASAALLQTLAEIYRRWCIFFFLLKGIGWLVLLGLAVWGFAG